MINEFAHTPKEWNYLRGYIGLRSNGVVKNFVHVSPKPTKKFIHINFLTDDASDWRERFSEAGAVVAGKKRRYRVTVTPQAFSEQCNLIRQAIEATVKEHGA